MKLQIKTLLFPVIAFFMALSASAIQPYNDSSYQPTINVDGYYVDPTWRDVSYRAMSLKVKGDNIVAYKDPYTEKFVNCNIKYRKMTTQEKSQMRLTDSMGRSYELYVGDCKYTAHVGKLTIYFADFNSGKSDVFTMDNVDNKPYISPAAPHEHREINSIDKYIKTKIISRLMRDREETIPSGEIIISFIVYRDRKIGDIKILKTVDPSLNKDLIQAVKSINFDREIKIEPAQIKRQYPNCIMAEEVDCQYQINMRITFK